MSNVSMIDGHIDREERKLTDKEIIKALECCSSPKAKRTIENIDNLVKEMVGEDK